MHFTLAAAYNGLSLDYNCVSTERFLFAGSIGRFDGEATKYGIWNYAPCHEESF